MFIISNNLIGKMPIPDNAIIRVNLAWIKDVKEAKKILEQNKKIYLDYPSGRTKPPVPTITLDEAIELTKHKSVYYFAVSNAENATKLSEINARLTSAVELVPKIETTKGIENIEKMIAIGIKSIMLDKEDLYTNVKCNTKRYNKWLERIRSYKGRIKILELQGVVFI